MTRDIFIWWLTAQGFGLVGLPLAQFCFRALPDRGYAFGKALGLLLSGYLAWLLAMLGLAPFGRGLLVVCAATVCAIGLFIIDPARTKNHPEGPRPQGQPRTRSNSSVGRRFSVLSSWFLANWRLILTYEALFALALVFLALLRSHEFGFVGPNPWGTERPMDYALFNAIRSSASFPPHDPWLAGYSINYYYFGYLLMASVSLVSGVDWAVAYNLSLALIFALTALGVAGIVANLIALTASDERHPEGTRTNDKKANPGRWSLPALSVVEGVVGRVGAVLITVVLVLFAANQNGALQVIVGDNRVVALDARQLAAALTQAAQGKPQIALPYPANTSQDSFGTITTLERTDRTLDFDWWWPSRSVWDDYTRRGDPTLHYSITEFPFFSFWLGDMHPHVMALPFGLLALALALQTLARPAAPAFAMGRRGWAELAITGVILGSLYALNSWDFPTYLLLFLGALLLLYVRLGSPDDLSLAHPYERTIERPSPLRRIWWRHYGTQAILALLASWLLFAPFYMTFRSLVGSKDPLINAPILAAITRTIGFVTWSRTPLTSFLIIFGLMLAPLLVYIVAQGRQLARAPEEQRGDAAEPEAPSAPTEQVGSGWTQEVPLHFVAPSPVQSLTASPWRYLPLATLVSLIVGALVGFPLLALLPLAAYAAWLALARAAHPAAAFVLWAFALVCLICFGTEVVYIRDVFESRMNTIFKFYYQAWLIWGVLAGYALWWLFARRWTMDDGRWTTARPKRSSIVYRLSSIVFAALFAALLAGALVYPWLTAGKAFREGQWVGLDGVTKREQTPDDAAAIAWLRANARPGAVVLEAAGGGYDTSGLGYGQVSGSTGLATVLGWTDHEQQWRGGDPAALAQLPQREADVRTIYSAGDVEQARALLRKYGVDYIYVGGAERTAYEQLDMTKLEQLGDPVIQNNSVTIYRVKE